jgi:hypothetical protein
MNKTHYFHVLCIFFAFVILCSCQSNSTDVAKDPNLNYSDLVNLFKEWRTFEKPPMLDGAPNYTAKSFNDRVSPFKELQFKLSQFDTTGWPISHKVDWHIIQAEMNGFDFNHRILQPWVRDPAFYKSVWTYKSDVPAHEGPTHHATTEIWQYNFPLSEKEKTRLIADLKVIPPLNEQAKENLKGNARDLWITGINDIEQQSKDLAAILSKPGVSTDTLLAATIAKAITSTDSFVDWLKEESVNKNGPSGIGKENYSWYLQNVHLVPLSWEDEVMLLKRELARAWSSLKMEEHRNRSLPPLVAANSEETYNKMAEQAANSLLTFLDEQEIVTVADYFEPALQPHLGEFLPEDKRNFFTITEHYDPRPLYSHFYHWFELARMEESPNTSEIRRGPLLYNIFDSRNEGMATAVEELFMQAGLYDDSPRVREIVYIMIAQRAARGLGSLYAHANEMSFEEAGAIHSEYTPRGWMKTEKELLIFEQQLYLRQPGYGTSYISGKYLIENAMADFARIKELNAEDFKVKDFFDSMNSIGNIPVSLAKWELTGSKN